MESESEQHTVTPRLSDTSTANITLKQILVALKGLGDGHAGLAHSISELVVAQNETKQAINDLAMLQRNVTGASDEAVMQITGLDLTVHTVPSEPPGPNPMFSAGERLTRVFELLEPILLDVDMETVFFAQFVNRSFASTIRHSRLLQQKLFLIPGEDKSNTEINPLLIKTKFLERLPIWWDYETRRLSYTPGVTRGHAKLRFDHRYGRTSFHWSLDGAPYNKGRLFGPGSWRRMYLTRNPRIASFGPLGAETMVPPDGGIARACIISRFDVDMNVTMDKLFEVLAADQPEVRRRDRR
ncbi:hypothetical protein LTR56_027523 [Elasticomyces elasticus]|nr:hypothetical protein LTR56_027523 [Elasticomyces elasticus]KAK4902471.1 hypothetical protein LTR49_027019 [Elasticomyces elasticus]